MNTNVLNSLEPQEVFYWFEQICNIPHGSGNTKKISDFLVNFAKDRNLKFIQDESNNVIIYKDAFDKNSDINDEQKKVILQGHIDMVCEKVDDCDIDFINEGLKLKIEDGFIKADGTTLGGDDGIAVAYMLAILDSKDIQHPPLECVFTVDEEIGMLGAAAMDMSVLKGRKLLNIDSEEEGYLLVSCAGGASVQIRIPLLRRGAQGKKYIVTLSGLRGGHSGVEINKGRANADAVLGNVLKELSLADDSMKVVSVKGGLKDNAIPVKATAVVVSKNFDILEKTLNDMQEELREILKNTDPDILLSIKETDGSTEEEKWYPLDELLNLRFLMLFGDMPFGVRKMSSDIPGLVQTSLNLGILDTTEDEILITYSVRSSRKDEKQELIEELVTIAESIGATIVVTGAYPAWEYKKDSELREIMTKTYEEMFHKPMVVQAIHAGVECGLFSDKLEGLDAVSFGPDILDIHTPKERLNIDSVKRTWEYIKTVLSELS
ncbi:MAG: aminoacyl-histidine dipeptidase [Eubacterium sp.]|nr:aminoacyl-histidine dipeptidase [Eubacterium sp.]